MLTIRCTLPQTNRRMTVMVCRIYPDTIPVIHPVDRYAGRSKPFASQSQPQPHVFLLLFASILLLLQTCKEVPSSVTECASPITFHGKSQSTISYPLLSLTLPFLRPKILFFCSAAQELFHYDMHISRTEKNPIKSLLQNSLFVYLTFTHPQLCDDWQVH